jgi:thioredoxin 1
MRRFAFFKSRSRPGTDGCGNWFFTCLISLMFLLLNVALVRNSYKTLISFAPENHNDLSVPQMAQAAAVVQPSYGRLESWSENRLAAASLGIVRDLPRDVGLAGSCEGCDTGDQAQTAGESNASREAWQLRSLGTSSHRVRAGGVDTPTGWLDPKAVAAKQVGGCRCDDCKCPHPSICERGDCRLNYVVLFTAKWCGACKAMYPNMEKLESQGYIVYLVDVDEHPDVVKDHKVKRMPTILIFDQGKEVKRYVGTQSFNELKSQLKTRDQQPAPKPDAGKSDYSLL